MTRAVVGTALLLAVTGCGRHQDTVCPAIGYVLSPNVVVQLAEDWPPRSAHVVVLRCDPACTETLDGERTTATLTEPVDGGAAGFDVTGTAEAVVVTVQDVRGADLAELVTELEFERVSGSAECGGPSRAMVRVAAP